MCDGQLPVRPERVGVEALGGEVAERRVLGGEPLPFVALVLERPPVEAQREQRGQRPADLDQILAVLLHALRVVGRGSERAAEVEEVVPDEVPAPFLDVAVDRVDRARIEDRQPGEQHPARAQRPAVLMGNAVVRIVGPHAQHVEPAQDVSRDPGDHDRPHAAVGQARHLGQRRAHVRGGERPLLHAIEEIGRGRPDLQIGGVEIDRERARERCSPRRGRCGFRSSRPRSPCRGGRRCRTSA